MLRRDSSPRGRFTAVLLTVLFCFAGAARAQTVAGTISGSVYDSGGLPISAAAGKLIQTSTGDQRAFTTDSNGLFTVTSVLPGEYTISIEVTGFKRFEKQHLMLTQAERLALGKLQLEVGSVTESITVTSQGAAVEVESGDRTQMLTGDQMNTMQSRGRNYLALLTTLPGMVGSDANFETDGFQLYLTPNVNGVSNNANSTFVDGVSGGSASNPNYSYSQLSMDSIAEVKVSVANFRAEDGRNGGAIIKTVTKSGSRDFRGTLYSYFRNEALNANVYVNKMNGISKPYYRYQTYGGTFGGPVYIPGKFNTSKQKLFFFWSSDAGRTKYPRPLAQVTVPTALERTGDFSQTVDQNNVKVPIWDPLNNRTPFPNNVIPQNRILASGQAILNMFPLPNFTNRAISGGNYNYNYQDIQGNNTNLHMIKLDYNATSKLRLSGRSNFWFVDQPSYYIGGSWGAAPWNMLMGTWVEHSYTNNINASYTISPTMVNELSLSYRAQYFVMQTDASEAAKWTRSARNINLPQFYPSNNPNNFVPAVYFSGVPGAAAVVPPLGNANYTIGSKRSEPLMTLNESISKVHGPHTFKAGIMGEYLRYAAPATGNFAGNINFQRDSTNTSDTNWPYSNALIGTYRTYQETDTQPIYRIRSWSLDSYIQDTWKATRRLTLDFGTRLTWATPFYQGDGLAKTFVPSLYDPKKAVSLLRPALNSARQRVAQDPLTGIFYPATYIGAIAPNSGAILNGMVSATDSGVPRGFIHAPSILVGPRFGFAYDLGGNGKTAIRGGFGLSYTTRQNFYTSTATVNNTQSSFTLYYGSLNNFSTSEKAYFPRSVTALNPYLKTPAIMSYSFGIQRSILSGTVLDVAYVATLGRQLSSNQTGVNNLPFGTRFLPSAIDTTNNGRLPDDFLRPDIGYTSVSVPRTVNSHYHSLQVQLNRRFMKKVQYAFNYTFSKTMGYYDAYGTYFDNHLNYGKVSIDRTHSATFNITYDLPKASKLLSIAPVRWIFDGWQTSGTGTYQSGRPWGVSYSLAYSLADFMGGGDYNRVFVVQNPTLDHGERSPSRVFNTNAFLPPTKAGVFPGNAANDLFRGPGRNNWDVSFNKSFKLFREGRSVQVRWENYNIFNHASWNSVDNAARFDQLGNQVNTRFGKVIGALTPRTMQLALRVSF